MHRFAEERNERVQNLVDELGLRKCIDTKVGGYVVNGGDAGNVETGWHRSPTQMLTRLDGRLGGRRQIVRGISGGEKKRVSIACELIGQVHARASHHASLPTHPNRPTRPRPAHLALLRPASPRSRRSSSWTSRRPAWTRSPPTTSWSRCARFVTRAASCERIKEQSLTLLPPLAPLRPRSPPPRTCPRPCPCLLPPLPSLQIAASGRTVISTIHQPRSNIFALFDKIMLLSDGHVRLTRAAQCSANPRIAPLTLLARAIHPLTDRLLWAGQRVAQVLWRDRLPGRAVLQVRYTLARAWKRALRDPPFADARFPLRSPQQPDRPLPGHDLGRPPQRGAREDVAGARHQDHLLLRHLREPQRTSLSRKRSETETLPWDSCKDLSETVSARQLIFRGFLRAGLTNNSGWSWLLPRCRSTATKSTRWSTATMPSMRAKTSPRASRFLSDRD